MVEHHRIANRRVANGNVVLIAQSRVGKTSLLHEVISRLEDKYICLYLDLEDAKSPMDMVAHLAVATRLHKKLWKKILSTSESILRSVPDTIEIVEIRSKYETPQLCWGTDKV
ncbi:MAG: hypothetical protein K8S62_14905 [Candidatus Sabulitectum sp.]|nr:hypothetical protein [Candidatus Sabulitectum sp.]